MRSADERARQPVAMALHVAPDALPAEAGIDTYDKWDSLNHLRIVAGIEAEIGRPLETDEVLALVDLASVTRILTADPC